MLTGPAAEDTSGVGPSPPNLSLGDMYKDSQYTFPRKAVRALQFEHFFCACVEIMRPKLIVTMGRDPATWIGSDYSGRREIRVLTFGEHATRVIAIVHTGGWTWKARGFTNEHFRGEGRRIREALKL